MMSLAQRVVARLLTLLAVFSAWPAAAQFGVPAPNTPAVNTACSPFLSFPMSLNLGSASLLGLDGVTSRCAFQQVQAALNTRGQPNGLASLDSNGLLPTNQLPPVNLVLPNGGSIPKITLTALGSTGDVSGMSVVPQSFGAVSATLSTLLDAALPRVPTNAALKAMALPYTRIRRDGFAAPGDGGALDYTWSPSNCTAADDGAQVQPTGRTGCWLGDFSAATADVRVWGAQPGQTVDAPLRAAIAWACNTHVPLRLPYNYTNGQYLISSQINIGNGSAAAYSTCNNVSLEVVSAYAGTTSGTTPPLGMPIRFTGGNGAIPINVQGPIKGVRLKGIGIDCNGLCATGIRVSNTLDSNFEFLSVEHNTGPAFVVTSETANSLFSSLEGTKFYKIHAEYPNTGGSGMQIGSIDCTTCNYGVLGAIFEDMVFNYDGNTPSSFGIQFGMASQNTLVNVRTTPFFIGTGTPGNNGLAIKISPPPGALSFPVDNTFVHPLIAGPVDPGPNAAGWSPQYGGLNFVGWSTVYVPFPTSTVPGRYTGSDSQGNLYVAKPPQTWTPTDASGAGLSLTVQDAQWTQVGKVCTVTFALTFPTNSSNSVASLGGLPCTPQFGSASRAGGAPSYTDFATPFTILSNNGVPTANFYAFGGAGLTNSQFSGKSVRASLTFITN